jgi:hypothetical protein
MTGTFQKQRAPDGPNGVVGQKGCPVSTREQRWTGMALGLEALPVGNGVPS